MSYVGLIAFCQALYGYLVSHEWEEQRACAGLDPNLFYEIDNLSAQGRPPLGREPQKKELPLQVVQACSSCAVSNYCLTFALCNREVAGTWGGRVGAEVRALSRQLKSQGIKLPQVKGSVRIRGVEEAAARARAVIQAEQEPDPTQLKLGPLEKLVLDIVGGAGGRLNGSFKDATEKVAVASGRTPNVVTAVFGALQTKGHLQLDTTGVWLVQAVSHEGNKIMTPAPSVGMGQQRVEEIRRVCREEGLVSAEMAAALHRPGAKNPASFMYNLRQATGLPVIKRVGSALLHDPEDVAYAVRILETRGDERYRLQAEAPWNTHEDRSSKPEPAEVPAAEAQPETTPEPVSVSPGEIEVAASHTSLELVIGNGHIDPMQAAVLLARRRSPDFDQLDDLTIARISSQLVESVLDQQQ